MCVETLCTHKKSLQMPQISKDLPHERSLFIYMSEFHCVLVLQFVTVPTAAAAALLSGPLQHNTQLCTAAY